MIGKAIGLLAVMTAAVVVLPAQMIVLVYRSHQRRKSVSPNNFNSTALCSRCTAECHAGNHSHSR